MGMTLAVLGLTELRSRFADIITKAPAQVDAEIQYAGLACQKYAKQACPVDTGRLRSSIQYANTGLMSCSVGTDTYYGLFVEMGHRTRGGHGYVAPRPFLRPGFVQAKQELMQNLANLKV